MKSFYSPHGSMLPQRLAPKAKKPEGSLTGSPLFDQLTDYGGQRIPTKTPEPKAKDILLYLADGADPRYARLTNKSIDAGWTYFGQFLAHDLTLRRELGISCPRLNLDGLYGLGPRLSRYLYEVNQDLDFSGVRFALDHYVNENTNESVDDVFRVGAEGNIPLMADVRNDDNFLLNQLHCAFLRFHNKMAEFFHREYNEKGDALYVRTRRFVTWTYQWILVNEYLKLITGDIVSDLINCQSYKILSRIDPITRKPFFKQESILMPEFTVAALRMGHSQVRGFYTINPRDTLNLYGDNREKPDLRGFQRHPKRGPVDWHSLFTFDQQAYDQQEEVEVSQSRPIDLMIASPLGCLPYPDLAAFDRDLGHINIKRSIKYNMIIREQDLKILRDDLGISTLEHLDEIEKLYPEIPHWPEWENCKKNLASLDGWPLWIFILVEARILGTKTMEMDHIKQTLGPLGAQIIAEQLIWVLQQDRHSYLYEFPAWEPMQELLGKYMPIRKARPAMFTMVDVLYIAKHGI